MLNNPRNPRWSNAEKTTLDLTVNGAGNREMPITVSAEDDIGSLWSLALEGAFGPIANFQAEKMSGPALAESIRMERVRRVTAAYIDGERRTSLYGHYIHLLAIGPEKHDYDQKKEFAVLFAVAEWEERMLEKARELTEAENLDAARDDETWPKMGDDLAVDLQRLALES